MKALTKLKLKMESMRDENKTAFLRPGHANKVSRRTSCVADFRRSPQYLFKITDGIPKPGLWLGKSGNVVKLLVDIWR